MCLCRALWRMGSCRNAPKPTLTRIPHLHRLHRHFCDLLSRFIYKIQYLIIVLAVRPWPIRWVNPISTSAGRFPPPPEAGITWQQDHVGRWALAYRELDEVLGLTDPGGAVLTDLSGSWIDRVHERKKPRVVIRGISDQKVRNSPERFAAFGLDLVPSSTELLARAT